MSSREASAGVLPPAARACSTAPKRRSNFAFAPRSADFGVDAGMAGEIDHREQEIADLVLDLAV